MQIELKQHMSGRLSIPTCPDSYPTSRWLMVCPNNPDNKLHVLKIDLLMCWDASQPFQGCSDGVLL